MEDVKKLARKFVSESLAEQIADFIAKISTGAVNVSEENEKNLDDMRLESTEQFQNVVLSKQLDNIQHRLEKSKKAKPRLSYEAVKPKKLSTTKHPTTKKFVSSKWRQYNFNRESAKDKQKWQKKLRHKLSGKMSEENDPPKIHIKLKDNKQSVLGDVAKILQFHLDTRVDKDITDLQSRLGNEKINDYNRNSAQNLQKKLDNIQESTLDSTIGYAETIGPSDGTPDPSQIRYEPQDEVIRAHTNGLDIEHGSVTYPKYTVYDKDIILTTQKEKNEFDQYDNTKYPKSEFVATSGPVALPKLPPGLDKEDSEPDTPLSRRLERKDRKAWF